MIVYPAIDLYANKVVRLYQGEYGKKTEYNFSPSELVEKFIGLGSEWVHIVDLEGAKKGYPVHLHIIREIASYDIKIQTGGGLRTKSDIEAALSAGASRAYVGSFLVNNRNIASELYARWGDRIIPAVDVKNGKVAVSGWQETIRKDPYSILSDLYDIGYEKALITSVTKDGTFSGPDISLYKLIRNKIPGFGIIAAGGVASVEDVLALENIGCTGTVIGKALYDGKIELAEVMEAIN